MIRNRDVFDVEGHVPSEVVHRDGELDALSAALEPVVQYGEGRQTHIFGPSGAGKTCLARYCLDRLEKEAPHINRQYINCWDHYAPSALLYELADGVNRVADVRRGAVAHDELLQRVREADEVAYVVVLDEVDQVEEPRILYQLHRMPHVHCIYVCNDEDAFFGRLDERVASRIRAGEHIDLERYASAALVDILQARADAGLAERAAPVPRLEQIADLAAGDARSGVEILYQAARRARAEGHEHITPVDVEEAERIARSELRQKTLSQLTRHQRVVFEVLAEADGRVKMGTIEDRYADRVDEPKSRRTLKRYLEKLEQYKLVDIDGEKRGRTYATYG
jgi:cell division control protein 6